MADFGHDLHNWNWTWSHAGETAVDAIGVIPVIGVVKNIRNTFGAAADVLRRVDDVRDGIRGIAGGADAAQDLLRQRLRGLNDQSSVFSNICENVNRGCFTEETLIIVGPPPTNDAVWDFGDRDDLADGPWFGVGYIIAAAGLMQVRQQPRRTVESRQRRRASVPSPLPDPAEPLPVPESSNPTGVPTMTRPESLAAWGGPLAISLAPDPEPVILAPPNSAPPMRTARGNSTWSGWLKSLVMLFVTLAAAGFCFWQSGWTPGNAAGLHATALSPLGGPPHATKTSSGAFQTKRIADIVPMEWVLAGNPENEFDLQFGDDVDPDEWRLLTLVAPKKNGGTADVRMLRPAAWLDLQWLAQQPEPVSEFVCLAPLEKRLTGKTIPIHVPECGIEGDTQILSIEPCPPRRPRPGPEYRLVTATYRHHNAEVLDVDIDGEKEPIGSTPNHPFWSADLQKFVRADALHPGEHLRKADGSFTTVSRLIPRPGVHDVFNLEVQVDHIYHVAQSGVLVHNSKPCEEIALGTFEHLDDFQRQLLRSGRRVEQFPFASLSGPNATVLTGIRQAMDRANRIHFNTSGIDMRQFNAYTKNGAPQPGNRKFTNWELNQVLGNRALLGKTDFYGAAGSSFVPLPSFGSIKLIHNIHANVNAEILMYGIAHRTLAVSFQWSSPKLDVFLERILLLYGCHFICLPPRWSVCELLGWRMPASDEQLEWFRILNHDDIICMTFSHITAVSTFDVDAKHSQKPIGSTLPEA